MKPIHLTVLSCHMNKQTLTAGMSVYFTICASFQSRSLWFFFSYIRFAGLVVRWLVLRIFVTIAITLAVAGC